MNNFHVSVPLVDRLGWVLVHSVWQIPLLALAALVLMRAMRGCSAASRYTMLLLALASMVASPVVTLVVLPVDESMVAAEMTSDQNDPAGTAERPGRDGDTPAGLAASPEPGGDTRPMAVVDAHELRVMITPALSWRSAVDRAVRPWLSVIVSIWCLGVLAFAWRPLLSWHTVRRLRRVGVSPVPVAVAAMLRQTSGRLRLRQTVQILQSTLTRVPVVIGYLRPVILLPVSVIAGVPTSQLEAILAHELAHVRRHDFLVNLLQTLVETLFFYHPAVWWLSHRIRIERENCCDDLAVSVLDNRVEYGRALLAIEELRGTSTALALGARGGSLLDRVQRLFHRDPAERAMGAISVVGVGLLAMVILAVGVWNFTQADDDGTTPGATAKLNGGIEVKLLGVSYQPSENQPWWTPEGAALPGDPFESRWKSGKTRVHDEGEHRELALEITGAEHDVHAWVDFAPGEKLGMWSTFWNLQDDEQTKKEMTLLRAVSAGFPKGDKQRDVLVRLAVAPWHPYQMIDLKREKPKLDGEPEDGSVQLRRVQKLTDGTTQVDLVFPAKFELRAQHEVVAQDIDGNEVKLHGKTIADAGARGLIFRCPVDRLAMVGVRFRWYTHEVTFENVSLFPDHKTKPATRVKKLRSPADEQAAREAAAERAAWDALDALNVTVYGDAARRRTVRSQIQNLERTNFPENAIRDLRKQIEQPVRAADFWNVPAEAWTHIGQLNSLQELRVVASDLRGQPMDEIGRLTNLRRLEVTNSKCNPQDLAALHDLADLEHLEVMFTVLGEDGAWRTEQLGELTAEEQALVARWVAVGSNRGPMAEAAILTDRVLASLGGLHRLRTLRLANTYVSGRGLESLKTLPAIEELDLTLIEFTPEAARTVGGLRTLKRFRYADVTDETVAELARLSELEDLEVWSGGVTDRGVDHLLKLSKLRKLAIRGSQLSDAGPQRLATLPHLESLDLSHSAGSLSTAGVKRFQEERPECKVTFEPKSPAAEPAEQSTDAAQPAPAAEANPPRDASLDVVAQIPDAAYTRPTADDQRATATIPAEAWGEPVDGLRVAVVLRSPPIDEHQRLCYDIVAENVSDHDIRFGATLGVDDWHNYCKTKLADADGNQLVQREGTRLWLRSTLKRLWLKPNERGVISSWATGLLKQDEKEQLPARPEDYRGPWYFSVKPGRYSVSAEVELGPRMYSSDPVSKKRTVLSPAKGEWSGKLQTGAVPVELFTQPAPADEAAAKRPPIEFRRAVAAARQALLASERDEHPPIEFRIAASEADRSVEGVAWFPINIVGQRKPEEAKPSNPPESRSRAF